MVLSEDVALMQVTKLFTGYVKQLLAEAGASRESWKAKDAAMYLVTALAVRGKTAAQGATSTNQLFDLNDFFQSQASCTAECNCISKHWPCCSAYDHLRI